MLELKNVSYKVIEDNQEKNILSDINLSFAKNKINVITGPNGCGKSTIIKLLMGINNPNSGQVLYNGKDITNLSISERAKLGITIAFQQPIKFKGLSVKDLLDIASNKTNTLSEACAYLSKVGLCAKDYINRELNDNLSGGELKRIELAIALAKGGNVFLFDEPEAGIDIWSFEGLISIFKSISNATIIIVSHQQKILNMADNIILLSPNKNILQGTAKKMMPKIEQSSCGMLGGQNE